MFFLEAEFEEAAGQVLAKLPVSPVPSLRFHVASMCLGTLSPTPQRLQKCCPSWVSIIICKSLRFAGRQSDEIDSHLANDHLTHSEIFAFYKEAQCVNSKEQIGRISGSRSNRRNPLVWAKHLE